MLHWMPLLMTAFDTDAVSEILLNNPAFVQRAATIPPDEQVITVVTVEELLRGRLDKVREAQSRRETSALIAAYYWLVETVVKLGQVTILRDIEAAEAQFRTWQAAKLKVKPNYLRIAAIVFTAGATLVTRNRRDFALIPGLRVEFWS